MWNELAVLAFRNGDLDSAARWLQGAVQLVPQQTGLLQRAPLSTVSNPVALVIPWRCP